MKKLTITITVVMLLFVLAFAQRKRKPKPRPRPKPAPTKPLPDLPTPKNFGNCASANFPAKCAIVGTTCVQGSTNEGCLLEGDNCTNCYRGSPTPQPKLQAAKNDWQGAILGKFVKGAGFVVDVPGAWGKKGIRSGDVITSVDGTLIDSAETLLKLLPGFYKARKFVVVQTREVAVK
jgi:hypothetical protein